MSDPKLVPVRLEDGTVGTVPEDQLGQAQDAGAEQVSEEELHHAEREAKYGGVGGQALAAGAGAARGLTFGLSDAALTGLDPELRDPLSALKEINPEASTAGEIAGAVAPALFSGGAGAIRGLGVIPRGAAALGGIAERGVAGLVGEGATSLLGRAAQRGLAVGAQGAVEGGLYGAGHEISEAALGDYDVTAQKLLAGAASGAEMGFAGGASLGALEGAGSAALGRVRSSIAEFRARRPVAPGETAPEAAATGRMEGSPYRENAMPESVVHKYADHFENAEQLSNAWKNREKLFAAHDDTVQTATRELASELTDAVKAERAVDMVSFGEAKTSQMAKLVPKGTDAERVAQAQTAWDALDRVRSSLAELSADPTKGGAGVALGRLDKWVERTQGVVEKAWKRGDSAEIFSELDNLKRAIGKQSQFGRSPFGLTEGAREFRTLYEDLRQTLEREDVWGAAGAAQKEINKATEQRLATRDLFQQRFLQQYGSTAGNPEFVADPAKLHSFASQLTDARNDLTHQTLRDYVANESKFLDAVEKHYDLSPADRANAAKARASFQKVHAKVEEVAKSVAEVNTAKRMMAEEKGHGVGGLLGLAVDVFSRPMTTLSRLASIEKVVKSVDDKIGRGVKVFMEKPPAAVPASKGEPLHAAFASRAKAVAEANANPETIADGVAKKFGGIADHAPNVAASVSTLEANKAAFLQSKLPAGVRVMNVLQPQLAKPRVSDQEKARFMRYAKAADDPLSVVRDLQHGKVSREGVEAVKALYPSIFDKMRTTVVDQIAKAKTPVPYAKQVQLGILFDAPVHPSLAPAFIASMQEQWAPDAKGERKGAAPHSMPHRPLQLPKGGLSSPVDRIEGR